MRAWSESHAPDLPMSMAGIEQKNSEQKSLPRTPIGLEAQIWQYAPDLAILSDEIKFVLR